MKRKLIFQVILTIFFLLFVSLPVSAAVSVPTMPTYLFNPTITQNQLSFKVSAPPETITIYIVNFDKRVFIKTIGRQTISDTNNHSISWNGKDNYNTDVPNGQYYYKIVDNL